MHINVSLCAFYCGLWNKCSKLKGMSKLHVFFLSNGAIKIKILENDRDRPITHTADFQTSNLITCTLFVGNGYFQSNFFNTLWVIYLCRINCSILFLDFTSHFHYFEQHIFFVVFFSLSWWNVIFSLADFNCHRNLRHIWTLKNNLINKTFQHLSVY